MVGVLDSRLSSIQSTGCVHSVSRVPRHLAVKCQDNLTNTGALEAGWGGEWAGGVGSGQGGVGSGSMGLICDGQVST